MLCVNTHMHAMHYRSSPVCDSGNTIPKFDKYLQGDNQWKYEEELVSDNKLKEIAEFIRKPYACSDLTDSQREECATRLLYLVRADNYCHDFRDDQQNKRALVRLSQFELTIAGLAGVAKWSPLMDYKNAQIKEYLDAFNYFFIAVGYKQLLLQQMGQAENKDDFNHLSHNFEALERHIRYYSQWLAAARSSGQEHYIGLAHLAGIWKWSHDWCYRCDTPLLRIKLWQEKLKDTVLHNWRYVYHDVVNSRIPEKEKYQLCLNQVSMAIIRHQLYKGFEGLNYKKTIEYTGPAICRVKKIGEEPRDISFETLMAALDLAEERAKKAAQKDGKREKLN